MGLSKCLFDTMLRIDWTSEKCVDGNLGLEIELFYPEYVTLINKVWAL